MVDSETEAKYLITIGISLIWGVLFARVCLSLYYSYIYEEKTLWIRFIRKVLFVRSNTSIKQFVIRLIVLFFVMTILFFSVLSLILAYLKI